MEFNKAYSDLTNLMPPSLLNELWMRLTTRKRNPLTEEEVSSINPIVEAYLKHEVDRYRKKLKCNRKNWISPKKALRINTMDKKDMSQRSYSPHIVPKHICNHEQDLDTLRQQLLEYNRKTFETLIQDLTSEYEKRVNANKEMRCEIENMRAYIRESEKFLALLKSNGQSPESKDS